MEEIREILYKTINDKSSLCNEDVVKVSQQLDKIILSYYLNEVE